MKYIKIYKSLLLTVLLMLTVNIIAFACDTCNQNQPKILKNITHGNGPQSNWDYFVVIAMVMITVYTLYATVRCFIKPTESKYDHIKNTVLKEQ